MTSRKTVRRRLEALRAAGYPASMAEFEARYPWPEAGRNAADVYVRAFAAFVGPADGVDIPFFGQAGLPEKGAPLPEAKAAAISQYLTSSRECLSLLREAGDMADCRYDRDVTDLLPNPGGLRSCANLLRLNTVFQGYQGDAHAALLSVRDGLRLGDSLGKAPVLISHLVRMNLYGMAIQAMEQTLDATGYTDRQLQELDEMLAAAERSLDLVEAMVGERCFMIETYKAPSPIYHSLSERLLLRLPCVQRTGLIDCLDYIDGCIETSKLPRVQQPARLREMEEAVDRLSVLHAAVKEVVSMTNGLMTANLRFHALATRARTALAIERHRLATGKVPERLEDLVPQYLGQVPTDPFNGQPFSYQRTESGYLLYSLMEDNPDNGP